LICYKSNEFSIMDIMHDGVPVCISFENEIEGDKNSNLLFCEMVQKARYGEKFLISSQKCRIAEYIFNGGTPPYNYYLKSNRYSCMDAAKQAIDSFPSLVKNIQFSIGYKSKICNCSTSLGVGTSHTHSKCDIGQQYKSIRIEPLSKNQSNFDLIILYLTPEKAMRIIQAYSYHTGERLDINTLGANSICGECTVSVLEKKLVISFGCKGSRKHSKYSNFELPIGISSEIVHKIEEGLKTTPETIV